jgi:hypothetical protein
MVARGHLRLWGRIDDAKAAVAEWLKTRPHSVLSKSCIGRFTA